MTTRVGLASIRWGVCAIALITSASSAAWAQDGGADAGLRDAAASDSGGGSGGAMPTLPSCAGAINTADIPVMGERMGPVDMLPGTGMGMAGSSTFGLRYNLLFSGEYTLRMAGTLHVNWLNGAAPLTVTTDGTPMTGYLRVRYGLRMMATLFVAGASIPIDLSNIIMDNESTGEKTFNPWQWNYTDETAIHLNVSAYRRIYMNSVTVGGEEYPYELQMRFNMTTRAKTEKIEFPNRAGGTMATAFGALNATTPAVRVGVPADGRLDLAYQWQPRIRYTGSLQFRLVVTRRVCVAGICSNIDVPTPDLGSIPLENELIPTAWERSTPVMLPLQRVTEPEIDFGSVRTGTSAMQQLIVLNPGASPLAVAVTTPGERAFQFGMNSACIAAGGMGSLPLTFMPSSLGSFMSEVQVHSNGASNNPSTVRLFGIGAMETVPPTRTDGGTRGDGGSSSGDGGREVFGPQVDATCACRAGHTRSNSAGAAWLLSAAVAITLGARRRLRARRAAA